LDKNAAQAGPELLRADQITLYDSQRVARLKNISFSLRAGEILGVAGVSGNGQSELLDVLAGIRGFAQGTLSVNGQQFTPNQAANPRVMRGLQLNHVPEDRLRLGLVKSFSAAETSILGYQKADRYNHRWLSHTSAIRDDCQRIMQAFDVRPPDPKLKSANFSGGNQQKLIIAREFDKQPQVLLVGQPTRGVDIGAIEFIHQQLLELREQGCAILLVSVELDEIMALSDRIMVLCDGEIVGEIAAADADKRTLGLMMANALDDDSNHKAQQNTAGTAA
jgi:simple sugar transport system ATP-binding protein